MLDQPHPAVLALRSSWDDGSIVTLHNLAPDPVVVPLTVDDLVPGSVLTDLFDADPLSVDDHGRGRVPVGGLRLRLAAGDRARFASTGVAPSSTATGSKIAGRPDRQRSGFGG